ncbi:GNAT family N-acetyltransferase [Alkaliphilus serpentinus]|uniref:GNAT family N-acetyltransferase n=1 Tax=Alkaliphilus serpentinus TaxID=1482731 RepID=A0A833M9Y0_9FIRM|nr:GNAT family N-acetyltransferase [Alkaliphilus serpentinus]KAB3531106.1 GNAT family N-acetyltransferase [Alkaliphilus serpentinus]
MYLIRELREKKEFEDFCNIVVHAYPGFKIETEEQRNKFVEYSMKLKEDNENITTYGLFKDEILIGGMRFFNFYMKLLTQHIKVGGLGLVAVDFLHKKEKIAKAIVEGFINEYKSKGVNMVALYPFRPDFYKKMGFGFGASMHQYKVKPSNLPKGPSKSNVFFIHEEEGDMVLECYNRAYNETNGLMEKELEDFTKLLKRPRTSIVAYKRNEMIDGYIIYEVKPHDENFLISDIIVSHMIYHSQEALMELMTFLNSQSDQIRQIIFNLQDPNFRFILEDPTNGSNNVLVPVHHEGSVEGTGIMYRVVDIDGIFKDLANHNFNNVDCKIKLIIRDTLVASNNKSIVVEFIKGKAMLRNTGDYEVEVSMDIANFSSLLTASVDFKSLYKYGRATLTHKEYLNKVNEIFYFPDKPICLTMF